MEDKKIKVNDKVKKISNWDLLLKIVKISYFNWIFIIFISIIVAFSYAFYLVEPGIQSFGDGLWYSFALITTIGFGDIVAVTLVGRILSVILGVFAIVIVALVTGITIDFIQERGKAKRDASVIAFMDKLENLTDLSQDELENISEQIKKL